MTSKVKPSKWIASDTLIEVSPFHNVAYVSCGSEIIAQVWTPEDGDTERQFELAKLIAAAPETAAERDRLKEVNAQLLEALNAIVSKFESDPDDLETMDAGIKIARQAIKAASEGRAE